VTIVVLSTHFDDAVLSCYSVLGPGTTVVTVLGGLPPEGVLGDWDSAGGATSSRERVLERREEDRRALALSNSTPVHLDFHETQHVGSTAVPTAAELVAGLDPHLMVGAVYAPAGILNAEHKWIRDAALSLRPNATLYADLPYALRAGFELPPELRSAGRERREVQLDPALAAEKVSAFERYETQIAQLVDFFGPFVDTESLGREVFWTTAGESADRASNPSR
jgi:hypothetical protein